MAPSRQYWRELFTPWENIAHGLWLMKNPWWEDRALCGIFSQGHAPNLKNA
jgi:hypothetical protein